MEVEVLTRKHSRIYRCPDDINNFLLRVRLKNLDDGTEEVQIFKWQEKKYSPFEREHYRDKRNCLTDYEKKCHEDVKDLGDVEDIVFSFVEEDGVNFDNEPVTTSKNQNPRNLPVKEEVDEDDCAGGEFDYEESFKNAFENHLVVPKYEKMFIMADFGEYIDDTWLKCEHTLVSIKYNAKRKVIIMNPDFTQIQPYVVKVNGDNSTSFEYWLENASLDNIATEDLIKETEILSKMILYQRKLRLTHTEEFRTPPSRKMFVHVFLEILRGIGFDEDENIYVKYIIELPKNWSMQDGRERLEGVTPSCKSRKGVIHYGFPFDVTFECDEETVKESSCSVHFEAVSRGVWDRYRSEGYAYARLPLGRPGRSGVRLGCARVRGPGPGSELRRHFLGDYGACADPTWLGRVDAPQGEGMNKFRVETISTGELEIRYGIIVQHQVPNNQKNSTREKRLSDKLLDKSLVTSVEKVLEAFKRAKANMMEARSRV